MKKAVFLLLAALSAKSALAGEVGAQNPQFANSKSQDLVVAIVDTGVSTSWTSTPLSNKALADRNEQLQQSIDEINAQISEDLEQRIAQKLDLTFAN
jgi:hypothetical protein